MDIFTIRGNKRHNVIYGLSAFNDFRLPTAKVFFSECFDLSKK